MIRNSGILVASESIGPAKRAGLRFGYGDEGSGNRRDAVVNEATLGPQGLERFCNDNNTMSFHTHRLHN